jgi:hypothetical protein
MEEWPESDDSGLEELLDNDMGQLVVLLAAKELADRKKKRQRGSKMGRLCAPRNHALSHNLLMHDYFFEVTSYLPHLFLRRCRMRRSLFIEIVKICEVKTRYFRRKQNAAGSLGFNTYRKIYAVMWMRL